MQGVVFNIQRASTHDGPGVRTTVFLKGCGLRCAWCHNPESISPRPQIMTYPAKCIGDGACLTACPQRLRSPETGPFAFDRSACTGCGRCADACYAGAIELAGRTRTAEDVAWEVLRDLPFYRNGGGVTFSGGEPLLQSAFVAETARRVREGSGGQELTVAVDTALFVPWTSVEQTLPCTDLFLVDCKAVTPALHRRGTGQGNERILENLRRLAETGKRYWIRVPLIPGFNDTEEELRKIGALLRGLAAQPEKVEVLAFHSICSGKYAAMGETFGMKDAEEPSRERVQWAQRLIEERA